MKPSPLVSICIPVHDAAAVVADAIHSARAQRYPALEILVLDNASSDDTAAVVARAAQGDPRVRCLRHATNIGMAANFSACIAEARGDYVLVLCADDALEADSVQALATALDGQPDAVLAAAGRVITDASLRPVRIARPRAKREFMRGGRLMRECFAWGNRIGEPSAVMFRRQVANRGFNAEYSQLLDLEMWFHLLASGGAVLLPYLSCRIRRHGRQITAGNIRSARLLEDKRRFFRQFAPFLAPSLSMVDKLAWDVRMASSVARVRQAGGPAAGAVSLEVFHPLLFRSLLEPAVALGWRLRQPRW